MLGEPDIDGFYAELDEKIDIVIEQLLERLAIQAGKKVKNFPFLMGQGVWLGSDELEWEDTLEEMVKQGTLTMGFIGLAECLKALIGEHHGESEYAQQLGLEIIGHMRQRMDEATERVSSEFLTDRHAGGRPVWTIHEDRQEDLRRAGGNDGP